MRPLVIGEDVAVPWHRDRRIAATIDVGLALGAGALVVLVGAARSLPPGQRHFGPPLLALVLLVAPALALVWRRHRPGAVLALTVGATAALDLVAPRAIAPLCAIVALATIAALRPARQVLPAAAAVGGLALWDVVAHGSAQAAPAAGWLALAAAGCALGLMVRARRAELEALRGQAREATALEQARIARELHDVIAHNVSVMVVQAAAGGAVFDTHPHRSREALAAVECSGRAALGELRRLLGTIDERDRAPHPGLAEMNALAAQVRAAGIAVDVEVLGEGSDLATAVDLSAYRIVQEALTNTLRHAHATRAHIKIVHTPDRVTVEISDNGIGGAPGATGRGLAGMRARATLVGGELEVESPAGGGLRVRARLPTGGRVPR